ncbi:hypothetical protein ADK35_31125 [Streptomyces viridochromogenes]|nr:hypothetical protein ADK35_31125 [Streptomyces viridochromogenes]
MITNTTGTAVRPAAESGVFRIGGDLPVNRLGFGTMRLTGPGVSGEPADRAEAVRVLRRAGFGAASSGPADGISEGPGEPEPAVDGDGEPGWVPAGSRDPSALLLDSVIRP